MTLGQKSLCTFLKLPWNSFPSKCGGREAENDRAGLYNVKFLEFQGVSIRFIRDGCHSRRLKTSWQMPEAQKSRDLFSFRRFVVSWPHGFVDAKKGAFWHDVHLDVIYSNFWQSNAWLIYLWGVVWKGLFLKRLEALRSEWFIWMRKMLPWLHACSNVQNHFPAAKTPSDLKGTRSQNESAALCAFFLSLDSLDSVHARHWELGDLEVLWLSNPVITTWDLRHHVKNGIKYFPHGAGFRLSRVISTVQVMFCLFLGTEAGIMKSFWFHAVSFVQKTSSGLHKVHADWSWHSSQEWIKDDVSPSETTKPLPAFWPFWLQSDKLSSSHFGAVDSSPAAPLSSKAMPRMHRSVRSLILFLLAIASPWAPNFSVARKGTAAPSTLEACVNKVNRASFRRHIKGAHTWNGWGAPKQMTGHDLFDHETNINTDSSGQLVFWSKSQHIWFFFDPPFSRTCPKFYKFETVCHTWDDSIQKSKLFVFNDFGQVTRVMQTTDGETGSTRSGLWQASGKDDVWSGERGPGKGNGGRKIITWGKLHRFSILKVLVPYPHSHKQKSQGGFAKSLAKLTKLLGMMKVFRTKRMIFANASPSTWQGVSFTPRDLVTKHPVSGTLVFVKHAQHFRNLVGEISSHSPTSFCQRLVAYFFGDIIIPFIGDGVASHNRILSKPDTEMIILQDSAAIAVAKKTWTSEN